MSSRIGDLAVGRSFREQAALQDDAGPADAGSPQTTAPSIVQFYDAHIGRDHYPLSNFYESPITYQGLRYPNVEAAFQAAKSTNSQIRQMFAGLARYGDGHDNLPGLSDKYAEERTGHKAFSLGRDIALRSDWENIKLDVMQDLLRIKFSSGSSLAKFLLNTGTAYLEENAPSAFWGNGRDGRGKTTLADF